MSEIIGVYMSSVSARKQMKEIGKVTTPGKKRTREKSVLGKCDDFVRCAVRAKVHKFFFKNEPPKLISLLMSINSDAEVQNFKSDVI